MPAGSQIPSDFSPITPSQIPIEPTIASMAQAVFDSWVIHQPTTRAVYASIEPGKPAVHYAAPATLEPNDAVITVALSSGFRLRGEQDDLRDTLRAIASDPFPYLEAAYYLLPNGKRLTLYHASSRTADFDYAAALGLRNLVLGAVMHDLLLATVTDRLSQRLTQGLTVDVLALHRKVFCHAERGLTLETKLRDELDAFCNAIIASKPFGQSLRQLLKTVLFICRQHDRSSGRPC